MREKTLDCARSRGQGGEEKQTRRLGSQCMAGAVGGKPVTGFPGQSTKHLKGEGLVL